MTEPKSWLSIKEAALMVGRHQSRVYRWIDSGLLGSRTTPDGTLEVALADVRRVESVTKRGRPRGSTDRRRSK